MSKSKQTKKKSTKSRVKKVTPEIQVKQKIEELLQRVEATVKEMTIWHLNKVKEATGEILIEDVEYCLSLSERVKQHARLHSANPFE